MRVRRSTWSRYAHLHRSGFRVWLPSCRLTPFEPLPVLFHTGSAHGIRPSELSPPERYPPRFRGDEPTCRFSRRYSRPVAGKGRPNGPRLLGFHPSGSPWLPDGGLARRRLDAPLGFTLLGSPGRGLARAFTRAPPTRFAGRTRWVKPAGVPEYRSVLAWPGPIGWRTNRPRRTTLSGFPHRSTPAHSNCPPPGLCVHLVPRRTLLPTDRNSLGDEPFCQNCPGVH